MYYHHLSAALTSEECQAFIERGRQAGFEKAKVNHYGEQKEMTVVRNNERFEFDDAALARTLSDKLQAALGTDFPHTFDGKTYSGCTEHFRLYRYIPGQYFKTHRDGSLQSGQMKSEITVLFYLNDSDGGETVLMPEGKGKPGSHIIIQPKAGDALLFEHPLWHEGREVRSGEKLVLRADLLYR